MAWSFNPNEYEPQDFPIIPAGDYRARIADAVEKTFRSGNKGYEVTLEVSGFNSKVWLYLVINESDNVATTRRFGDFFNSFAINDYNLNNYRAWVGKVGAVRVKHEDYNGSPSARVAFCINRSKQDKLPPAKFSGQPQTGWAAPETEGPDDLPFN